MRDGCDNGKQREPGQRPLNAAPLFSLAGVLKGEETDMKRGMILATLLATLPVHALADGQKAPSWYGRISSKLGLCCGPTDCGHLWSNKYIKGNAAEGYWIWHADQWYAINPNAIVDMNSPDGKIHYCFQNGEIICVVLPASM